MLVHSSPKEHLFPRYRLIHPILFVSPSQKEVEALCLSKCKCKLLRVFSNRKRGRYLKNHLSAEDKINCHLLILLSFEINSTEFGLPQWKVSKGFSFGPIIKIKTFFDENINITN